MSIEHSEGLAGHSDGDVLLHAITDALLGAVSAGDIGTFFPPSDPRWKGAASSVFLQTALEEVATAGYRIVNVDTVLVMAKPKIVPIAGELRESVARLLGVKPGEVGIKAKTPEGLNLDHVAQAHCTVLLESLPGPEALEHMAAAADAGSEEELNGRGGRPGRRPAEPLRAGTQGKTVRHRRSDLSGWGRWETAA